MGLFTFKTKTELAPGGQLDPSGRLRIAELSNLIDVNVRNIINPAYAVEHTANGGTITHLPNEAAATLSVTTTVGSIARISSRENGAYIAGQGLLATLTGVIATAAAGTKNRIGYFDNTDGWFFQDYGGTISVVKRTSVSGSTVETTTARASWDDPLDGTGVSGLNIDFTKSQIFFIDFLSLGLGDVRFGVMIDGHPVVAHTLKTANVLNTVHVKTPNLFIRWECEQVDGTNAGSMKAICGALDIEGQYRPSGVLGSYDTGNTLKTVNTTETPLFAIRALSAYKNVKILPTVVKFFTASNRQIVWRVYLNPTITGGTWSSQVATGNLVEINSTITSFTGGKKIFADTADNVSNATGTDFAEKTGLGYQADGSPDILLITGTAIGGSGDSHICFNWKEIS